MTLMQLEELNMENSRLVNPELEHLRGIVEGLKAEVIITVEAPAMTSQITRNLVRKLFETMDGENGALGAYLASPLSVGGVLRNRLNGCQCVQFLSPEHRNEGFLSRPLQKKSLSTYSTSSIVLLM